MKPFPWKRKADEAREAAERARQELARAQANRGHVHQVADNIRGHREQNHFAEAFRKIVEG
jgi:hypothetical protein